MLAAIVALAAVVSLCAAPAREQSGAGTSPAPSLPALQGSVLFNGLPVPGALVSASRDSARQSTYSDEAGIFRFATLAPGEWTVTVEMTGFVTAAQAVVVPVAGPPPAVALRMRPLADMAAAPPVASSPRPAAVPSAETPPDDAASVINGSSINGAATPFAQPRAFGNNRPNQRGLYNFSLYTALGDSSWNARPYSFTDARPAVPNYSDGVFGGTIGGPLRIPWLLRYGPQTSLTFEHGVTHSAVAQSALMPTAAERAGDFSRLETLIRDPATGRPFAGNIIPADRISPVAAALLAYYPLPNTDGSDGLNFQAPVVTATTRNALQVVMNRNIGRRSTVAGTLAYQRSATQADSIFAFRDEFRSSSLAVNLNGSRQYGTRLAVRGRYQYLRDASEARPFFAGRVNVSGDAGISGNDQQQDDWGPPALVFPDVRGLADAERQKAVTASQAIGGEALLRRRAHNLTIGGDLQWQRASAAAQANPRGTLTFTGAATGSAFADFLLGVPSASALATGTADIQLRARTYDAYVNDDWRILPTMTLNLGLRWEYETPFRETGARLGNLDVAPDFSSVAPVTGASLIHPDRRGIEPRLAASWRPSLGSSLVIRASYGLYRNLGGYRSLAMLLAGQPPFARSFSVQNSADRPLTLAQPFPAVSSGAAHTIAIDPDLRGARAENWQISAQRELPGSLTVIGAYLGARGSQLLEAFAPNTDPAGAAAACPSCPRGFVFVTSGAGSIRHAGQFTLRRRLYGGFTATAQYTIARATDNASSFNAGVASLKSLTIAQDWRDLDAERGPSSFDQRHLFSLQAQYTTGVGLTGGTLVDGWWGRLYKDWTAAAILTAGSGLPVTPVYFAGVSGTGIVGVRPRLTGLPVDDTPAGAYANPAAFAAPLPGEWGDARRNSIRGPRQFAMDATLSRTFRFRERLNLEARLAATNVLNRVTFSAIDPVITSARFGRPIAANPMRALQLSLRLRF